MNTTVWDFSNTGSTFHAFINGQTAACRSSIAVPLQFKQNATTLAKAGQLASDRPGVTVCQRCTVKFTAAMHRYQASMAPSTGEGDHLPPAEEPEAATATPDLVEALAILRKHAGFYDVQLRNAVDVLDNAGIFSAIDQAVGKCTCPELTHRTGLHLMGCSEAPERARTGDCKCGKGELFRDHLFGCPATYPVRERRDCPADNCTLAYEVKLDGTLHKHLNDNLEPCPGDNSITAWARKQKEN